MFTRNLDQSSSAKSAWICLLTLAESGSSAARDQTPGLLCPVGCFSGKASPNPWDTAAGVLIVGEGGGRVTNFSGGTFAIDSREVLALNALVHGEVLKEFAEIFAGEWKDCRQRWSIAAPAERYYFS
jgi:hypothetical protein